MRRLVVLKCKYNEELQAAIVSLGFSPDAGLSGVKFTVTVGNALLEYIEDPRQIKLLFANLLNAGRTAYDSGVFIEQDPEWIDD